MNDKTIEELRDQLERTMHSFRSDLVKRYLTSDHPIIQVVDALAGAREAECRSNMLYAPEEAPGGPDCIAAPRTLADFREGRRVLVAVHPIGTDGHFTGERITGDDLRKLLEEQS